MRRALAFVLAFSFGLAPLANGAPPSPIYASPPPAQPAQYESSYQPYTAEQLDNLLAPIALYPDPLLAQVLVAATFVDQIDEAARWVRSYGQNGVDDQPWDVSVRAVAHYPSVLNMMDDNLDWTTAVGQTYVSQSTDVMASIQRLRAMAQAQGNLVTTPQQQVVIEPGYISIWPASPTYLYVPTYDPSIVFFRPAYAGGIFTAFSFGPALAIGVWLNLDCDWSHRRVYYTGWQGGGWIARSRSHIRMNARYVNPRFSTVVINRHIVQRPVNYAGLSRYRAVHRNVNFGNRGRGAPAPTRAPERRVPNKIIDRNIPPNQRLEQFRGRQRSAPAAPSVVRQPRPTPGPAGPPGQSRVTPPPRQPGPAPATRPAPQQPRSAPLPARPPGQLRTTPPARQLRPTPGQPPPAARAPSPTPAARPPTIPAVRQPTSRPTNAFGRGGAPFDPRAASQRGQQSRQQMKQKPAGKAQPKGRQQRRQPGERSP